MHWNLVVQGGNTFIAAWRKEKITFRKKGETEEETYKVVIAPGVTAGAVETLKSSIN